MKIDKYFHLYGDKDGVNVHFEEISPPTEKQTDTAELPKHYGKDDLIHRETARRIIDSPRNKEQMLMMLASIPKVENYAGWVAIDDYPSEDWECSHCGYQIYGVEEPYRFCPNCGKKMWK